jgi:hypothetical protein
MTARDMAFVRALATERIVVVMPMDGQCFTWWGCVLEYEKGDELVVWNTPIGPLYEAVI